MKKRFAAALAILITFAACRKENSRPVINPPVDTQSILLKEIVMQALPSPYYHFIYDDSGYITHASYAGGLQQYMIDYAGGRISRIHSIHPINKDMLQYEYTAGQPALIRYFNEAGELYKRAFIAYNTNGKLENIEWEIKQSGVGFVQLRAVTLSYFPDGNLQKVDDERQAFEQQTAGRYITTYAGYDNNKNVDGFAKFHIDGEHLLLFPSQRFQKNNPVKEIRTGTGIGYEIDFSYAYDGQGRPTQRVGAGKFTSGPNSGQGFTSLGSFTYYP